MALDIPTVTLYSKGRSAIWNPGDANTLALEAPADFRCAACALPKRGSDVVEHACLAAIGPDAWMDAISAARRLPSRA
jgi:ADP-heptose:LPS heptosyltransferase